jgi:hypothetical protein
MDAAGLVVSGHRYAEKIVRSGPLKFAGWLSVAAIIALLLPARFIGVHSLPGTNEDVGIWWQANWSLQFVVVLPAIFGGFVALAYWSHGALGTLCDAKRSVIVKSDGAPADDYHTYISRLLRTSARRVTWTAIVLAIILSLVDILTVVRAVRQWDQRGSLDGYESDWSVAFTFTDVSRSANLAFDALAYTVQGVAIFLGFFCLMKFWLFMQAFSISLRDRGHPYEYKPWLYDPEHRLGLKPIGRIFNIFLLIVVAFQIYVLIHRLQQIHLRGSYRINEYLNKLFSGRNTFTSVTDGSLYSWQTIDEGTWLLLILMTLPMIAVAYFPLWKLRGYIKRSIEKFYDEDMLQLEAAKTRGDSETADRLQERIECWLKAEVWPNGDDAGWRLLGANVAISLAAWAPPLFIWFASAGLIGETLRKVLERRQS